MISQEDVAALAGLGREQKFCMIEQLARKRLTDARRAVGQNGWTEYGEYDYAVSVSAAAAEFGINELNDFELPWPSDEGTEERCRMYRARATRISQQLLFRHATKSTTVGLDASTKEKIGHWLKQMREAVQAADVSNEKKDRLYALIDELQAEVDRDRTPVHAAGELWLTICTYMGEGAKNALAPATPYIERICGALGLAKKTEDAQPKKLPPARDPKRIEGPKTKSDKNGNAFGKSIDDEIPF